MQSQEFIQKLKECRKPIFTLTDLVKITGKERSYLKVYLFRLKKRNLLQEIERGKYALPQHPFIIASHLQFPGYISFLSAYAYYQITTQIPRTVQVVGLRSKKKVLYNQHLLQFIRFPPQKMFGYVREKFSGSDVFIAEREKAIIDSLYLPEYCPLDETMLALQEENLNIDTLVRYALRMRSSIVVKRLGYLLEQQGVDIFRRVGSKINARYDYFNPPLKKVRGRSAKWRLLLNEVG